MSDSRPPLRETFESAADVYDSARPSYPERLFDDLVELARLRPGDRLLEIGCGTGKATRPLLERGFSVVCVELGEHLAKTARLLLAGYPFEVQVAPFETWRGELEAFDLVYAATAWHWVEPTIRYRKVHELLRPNRHLAFWSAGHAFPADADPFFLEIQDVYEAIGEAHADTWPPPPPDEVADGIAEIEASGLFDEIRVRRYVWETVYTADEYIALLDTFSGHITMDASKRARLYGEIRARLERREDQSVRRHWLAILHVARRRG